MDRFHIKSVKSAEHSLLGRLPAGDCSKNAYIRHDFLPDLHGQPISKDPTHLGLTIGLSKKQNLLLKNGTNLENGKICVVFTNRGMKMTIFN